MSYEYKVVPAPPRGLKAKGVKTAEDRFAHALETQMNELAAEGWEYLRTDTLPSEQREGLMSKTTVYQNMLVFRRTKSSKETQVSEPVRKIAPPLKAPVVEAKLSEEPDVTSKPDLEKKSPSPDLAAE